MDTATTRTNACPLCSGTSLQTVGPKSKQVYYRCRGCGLVVGSWLWESSLQSDAEEIYDDAYLDKSRDFNPVTTSRVSDILERVESYVDGRRLFEVGFGNGQFLHTARERGWDVCGIEASAAACAWASRTLSLPVRQGLFEEVDIDAQSADVVASMETIEHMYDPVAFVQRAREVLKPGGILFLTTPNAGCVTARITGLDWRGYVDGAHAAVSGAGAVALSRRFGIRGLAAGDAHGCATGDPRALARSVARIDGKAGAALERSHQSSRTA